MVRTAQTIPPRELDLDTSVAAAINGSGPTDTGGTSRAGRLLSLPINRKVRGGKAVALACLAMVIAADGTAAIHSIVLLAVTDEFGINEAAIGQMHLAKQVTSFESRMNDGGDCIIGGGAAGRFDIRNEMNLIRVAAFGQMDLVAYR